MKILIFETKLSAFYLYIYSEKDYYNPYQNENFHP